MDSGDALPRFSDETHAESGYPPPAQMSSDEALRQVEQHLNPRLKDSERDLFRGIWDRKDYQQIYNESFRNRCQLPHMRSNIAGGLWKRLRPILGEKVNKNTLRGAVETAIQRWKQEPSPPPSAPLGTMVSASAAAPEPPGMPSPSPQSPASELPEPVLGAVEPEGSMPPVLDWSDSPDVMGFCGRGGILKDSEQQIRVNRCQLFAICGEAGVGKTWFAKQLALQLSDQYQRIAWVTLPREAAPPTLESLLGGLLATLGPLRRMASETTSETLPGNAASISRAIAEFVDFLMDYPSLILFDQFEALLQDGVDDGSYRPGYEPYGEFLSQLGQRSHRSCIVITSREKPNEAVTAPGQHLVQEQSLPGFEMLEAEEFLKARGYGDESPSTWRRLTQQCNGNPRALRAIASWIQDVHLGDIEDFLLDAQSFPTEIIDEQRAQFERLSPLEQEIMSQLCQRDSPFLTAKMLREMTFSGSGSPQNAQRSLLRRALLSRSPAQSHAYQVSVLMQQYIRQHA